MAISNDLITNELASSEMGIIVTFLFIALIMYLITAISLMMIAKKTKTENGWLAFIPFANVFLMANIAQKEWWIALIIILIGFIPFLGAIISTALFIYLWWAITERLGKSGALSLLILIPIVNLVYILYLGFSE